MTPATAAEGRDRKPPRQAARAGSGTLRRDPRLLAIALVLVLLGLLGFAPASRAAVADLPLAPVAQTGLDTPVDPKAPRVRVRDLPVGLPHGFTPRLAADLQELGADALGRRGAQALQALLESDDPLVNRSRDDARWSGSYPGQFADIEQLLDQAPHEARSPAAATLAAGLIALSAVDNPATRESAGLSDAAPVAYALLRRAREVSRCDAETNLLLLLTADLEPDDDLSVRQARRAELRCPGDPTPGWLLGQFQSRRASAASAGLALGTELPADGMSRAPRTFAALARTYPASPDVWAGQGDLHLRAGAAFTASQQPFSARREYQGALAAFDRAGQLGAGMGAVAGRARAHLGLGSSQEAVAVLTAQQDRGVYPGPVSSLLVEAQESARQFAAAEATARALDRDGRAAYPSAGPVSPDEPALSTGVDRFVSLDVQLRPFDGGMGGGGADDISFIPTFRPQDGVTGSVPDCPGWSWRRDAILTGHASTVLQEFPNEFASLRPGDATCPDAQFSPLPNLARLELGMAPTLRSDDGRAEQLSELEDTRQNLFRWAGDLDRAAAAVQRWDARTDHAEFLPAFRLAEIRYLQRRFDEAAADFGAAARRGEKGYDVDLQPGRALLGRGAALLAAGRESEGQLVLQDLDREASSAEAEWRLGTFQEADESAAFSYAVLSYYARLQLADSARRSGHQHIALDHYAAARERLPLEYIDAEVVPGVLHNNMALAQLAAGRVDDALDSRERAVATDPANPVFLLTSAAALEQAGDVQAAAEVNAAVLASDPTAFPAANNRGVDLARLHRLDEAELSLRQAVGARSDYALGWFNLGVVYSRDGPLSLLAAQGAWARAYELDPTLVERPRELVLDEHVYETGLDLSKPLAAGWGLGAVERRQPLGAVGLLGALVAAIGVSRALSGSIAGKLQQSLEVGAASLAKVRLLGRRRHLIWAVVATVAAFAIPAGWRSWTGLTALVVYTLGVGLLVAVAVALRQLAASRSSVVAVQRSWPPGLVLGVVSGAAGVPWAPVPYLRVPRRARRLHLVGPVGLALLGGLMLVEASASSVPLTRALGIAAITMACSMLLPLRPLDGAAVGRAGVLVGGAAVAGAILVVLGLV